MKINNKDFYNKMDLLKDNINYSIQRGLYNCNMKILKNRIANSKEKKTGEVYKIYRNGKVYKYHTASSENVEGDARITGKLNEATNFKVSENLSVFGINKNIPYADFIQRTRQSLVKAGTPELKIVDVYVAEEIKNGLNNFKNGNFK